MLPIVSATGLVQGYRRRPVLDGVDFAVSAGVLGLLGPNGAGKTTLLRTLATVLPPWKGTVEILGERMAGERVVRRTRRDIGYLPQEFGFPAGFSVYDAVRYCAWLRGTPRARAHDATMTALRAVGLAELTAARVRRLSGGMRRRVGIATAIVGSPRLVLLDEPAAGLDPALRLVFRDAVRSLPDSAVVLSTHLVDDAGGLCDELAVLAGGRVVFRGAPAGLAAAGAPDAPGQGPLERGYLTLLREWERAR